MKLNMQYTFPYMYIYSTAKAYCQEINIKKSMLIVHGFTKAFLHNI